MKVTNSDCSTNLKKKLKISRWQRVTQMYGNTHDFKSTIFETLNELNGLEMNNFNQILIESLMIYFLTF